MEGLISVIAIGLGAAIGLFGKFLSDESSSDSKKKYWVIAFVVAFLGATSDFLIYSNDGNGGKALDKAAPTEVSNSSESQTKTNQEITAELILKGADVLGEKREEHRERKAEEDSTQRANRKEYFAYQIGPKSSSDEEIWAMYEKLKKDPNIYVFKESRKSFRLVKWDLKPQEELRKNHLAVKNMVASATTKVEVINLTKLCEKADENIGTAGKHKVRRNAFMRCLECQK